MTIAYEYAEVLLNQYPDVKFDIDTTKEGYDALVFADAETIVSKADLDSAVQASEMLLEERISTYSNVEAVRAVRNRLLAECDWTQAVDAPLDEASKLAWQDYRQALRDITDTAISPETADWPTKPA
jgi:hypothetical protein